MLEDPENGTVIVDSLTVGSLANFTCNSGFVISGADVLVCGPNGTWSDDVPTCESELRLSQ